MRSFPTFPVINSFFRNLFITKVRVSFSSVYNTCTKGPHDCSNFRNLVKIGEALKEECCLCTFCFLVVSAGRSFGILISSVITSQFCFLWQLFGESLEVFLQYWTFLLNSFQSWTKRAPSCLYMSNEEAIIQFSVFLQFKEIFMLAW